MGSRLATAQTSINVAGPPAAIVVNTAVAGNEPAPVTRTSSYTLLVKGKGAKHITASMGSNMPAGTTLSLNMAAPSTGVSSGPINLTIVDQTMVSSINNFNPAETMAMTYVFTATVAAGVITSRNRTVTFTIVNGP